MTVLDALAQRADDTQTFNPSEELTMSGENHAPAAPADTDPADPPHLAPPAEPHGSSGCPSRDSVFVYAMGIAPPDRAAVIDAHVKVCTRCRARVAEYAPFREYEDEQARGRDKPTPRRGRLAVIAATVVAIAAIILVAIGLHWLLGPTGIPVPKQPIVQVVPEPPAPKIAASKPKAYLAAERDASATLGATRTTNREIVWNLPPELSGPFAVVEVAPGGATDVRPKSNDADLQIEATRRPGVGVPLLFNPAPGGPKVVWLLLTDRPIADILPTGVAAADPAQLTAATFPEPILAHLHKHGIEVRAVGRAIVAPVTK